MSNGWAHMLLVHGLADHSERYARTGRLIADAGIDVTAFDLRGHGGSGGRRGDVERWTDYLDDIAVRLAAGRRGGWITGCPVRPLLRRPGQHRLRVVGSASTRPAGAVGAGPRRRPAALAAHVVPLLARILPTVALKNAWSPDVPSRDPEVGRLAPLDPGSPDRSTIRIGAFGFAAQERVRSTLSQLAYPGLRHETLNEPEGPQVVADVVAWLRDAVDRL